MSRTFLLPISPTVQSLSTRLAIFSSTDCIFFQSKPRPNRRQQINQTKQQQRFRSRNQQNESGKIDNNRDTHPNRPTDKNCQFISRRLNVIEAETKHEHSINSYPDFVRRRHPENVQEQIRGEQQNQTQPTEVHSKDKQTFCRSAHIVITSLMSQTARKSDGD